VLYSNYFSPSTWAHAFPPRRRAPHGSTPKTRGGGRTTNSR